MGNDIKCMYFNHTFKDKPQGKQCGWVQKSLTQVNITIENLADALRYLVTLMSNISSFGRSAPRSRFIFASVARITKKALFSMACAKTLYAWKPLSANEYRERATAGGVPVDQLI